ncbi:translocation and assembly module TamB [Solimonas aquatica]|uniref:Translocation and assembly module TamB n=1 Tax=Solimonas aquatica TaxID=489703 RepID=A0A1H9F580_9GAMM|nr:translocation/assembly module TamB domain-containing protein [Solimonas aquatica]SEQ33082.1 translocation and assembly module TamB [Solimonas aquatica]
MKRFLQHLLLSLGAGFSLLLTLIAGALIFVLFTTPGAQLGFEIAGKLTGDMIRAQGVEGRLWGPLRVRELHIGVEAVDIDITQAEAEVALPLLLLAARIDAGRVRAGQVRIKLKPTPDTPATPPVTELPLGLRVRDGAVRDLRVMLLDGSELRFTDIELNGGWIGPRVNIRHAATTTPWVGRVALAGKARLLTDGIDFPPTQLHGFLEGTLQGHFGYNQPSDLTLRWQQLRWPPQELTQKGEQEISSGGGEAHWRGLLDDYRYELSGALQLPRLPLQLKAQGRGTLSDLQIETLQARGLGGELQARAALSWNAALRIDGEGSFSGLDPKSLLPELPGRLNGRFKAQTRLVGAAPQVQFEAQLENSQLRDRALNLQARGQYAGETLRFESLHLDSGSVQLDGSGQILPSLDARATLSAADLGDAWPGLSGSLQLQAQAQGALKRPHLIASAQAQKLHYQRYALASAQLTADVDLDRQLDVQLKLAQLDAGLRVQQAQLSIQGPLAAHQIALDLAGDAGSLLLRAHGDFDPQRLSWQGELSQAQLKPQNLPGWTLARATALTLSAQDSHFSDLCWKAGEAQACFGLQQNGAQRRFQFALREFALAYLQPLLPGGAQIEVLLHGDGEVLLNAQGLQDLRLQLATDAGRWQLGGLPPMALKPAHLNISDDANGSHLDLLLPFAEGGLSAQARLAPGTDFMQRALDGQLHVELPDLSWLHLVNVEIAQASGTLKGDVRLGGTLAQPQPSGELSLSEGTLRLVTPGIEVHDIRAQLLANGAEPLKLSAQASSGPGQLQLSGQINPWDDPLALDLKLSGDNFQAVNTREARVQVSPDLRITLAQQQLDVSGLLLIPKADITPKSLGDGSVSASGDQVLVGDDPGAQKRRELRLSADITLRLGEDVQFNGFGLKTQLKGAVQAIERPGVATRARGEINLDGGHYKAYGQDLSIETGRLIFNGPVTEPALDLRATRKPTDDITVGLLVRGDLRKPQFQLFSTPSMPQDQQLGWLILGRSLNETTSAADKAAVGGAATSLGLAGGAWLAQQLGSKVGIDEVRVGAKPGQTQDQAMFTVGKYLSPKLFIAYGVGLFQPGHIFRMQYSIGHGFKLQSETGVESGGDMLYTIERK